MGVSNSQKKEILLKSFDVLKARLINQKSDCSEIRDIIEQMIYIDSETAIEMWKYVLNTYKNFDEWNGNTTGYLTTWILSDFKEILGLNETIKIIFNNQLIREKLFLETYDIDYSLLKSLIENDKLYELNELLNDISNNQAFLNSEENNFGLLFERITDIGLHGASKNAVDLLLDWGNRLEDEESKAVVNLNLLRFM